MKKFFILIAITVTCLLNIVSCTSGNPLIGEWAVIDYSDPFKATNDVTKVLSDENYILQFHDNGLFSFATDCNIISGEFTMSGKEIHFLNLSSTELACDREIVERSVKSQLPMVESYDLTSDSILCLLGKRGNVLMKLVRGSIRPTAYDSDDSSFTMQTEAERNPKFIFAITSDSLLTCKNNFSKSDEDPLILDTTNPGLTDLMAEWINSLDTIEVNELRNTYALHITVGPDVGDATVNKVKTAIKGCGIEKFSISNFDIEN